VSGAPERLSDAQYERLRTLLAGAAGLEFDHSRREALTQSVLERARLTGLTHLDRYLELAARPGPERQHLLDEVTIQETYFFRNPPQMRALRTSVLPELLRVAAGRGRRLRIWSAGCSTGEEPYTIAMMLLDLQPDIASWDVTVLGTDISEAALRAARRGVYRARAVQLATPAELARFVPAGPGRLAVSEPVRRLVELRHHNLVGDPSAGNDFDLVLCRNVTIYFSRPTTRALMERLHASLRDGGYLFLGHSETLWQVSDAFRLVRLGAGAGAAYVYQRVDDGPRPRTPAPRPRRAAAPPRRADPPPSVPVSSDDAAAPVRATLVAGDYGGAARLAARALVREPLRAELHYLLGVALADQGKDAAALPVLRRAVYLAPGDGLAHFLLAGVLQRTGDGPAAQREFRAAALALSTCDAQAPELGGRTARELATLAAVLATRGS